MESKASNSRNAPAAKCVFWSPAARPSRRPVHRRLPHIKGRAEIQNTERGEKHRLGHADRPALQHGGREHSEDDESGVEDIDAADNPRAPVRRRVGLDRRK